MDEPAHDCRVISEMTFPVSLTEYDYWRGRRVCVPLVQQPSQSGIHAQICEVSAGNKGCRFRLQFVFQEDAIISLGDHIGEDRIVIPIERNHGKSQKRLELD